MTKRKKYILGVAVVVAAVALVFLFSLRITLLGKVGRFFGPEAVPTEIADVVIMEGTEFIDRAMVLKGIDLWKSGKAKRMIIVLHSIAPDQRPFAIPRDYPESVRKEIKTLGIDESALRIVVTHIHNPITRTAARGALDSLSGQGITRVILVSQGFHTRRSFLIYQYLARPLGIKIYPVACFDGYRPDDWWRTVKGPRDFLSETQKLLYYMVRGFIPPRLAY